MEVNDPSSLVRTPVRLPVHLGSQFLPAEEWPETPGTKQRPLGEFWQARPVERPVGGLVTSRSTVAVQKLLDEREEPRCVTPVGGKVHQHHAGIHVDPVVGVKLWSDS